MVLVDTPIWSVALRRRTVDLSSQERLITKSLYELVRQGRVKLLGPTRQEVLSGIRDQSTFARIREHLRGFPDVEIQTADYEEAALASNHCRSKGIASTPVDMLICAVALRYAWKIFTSDRDFENYRKLLKIELFLLDRTHRKGPSYRVDPESD